MFRLIAISLAFVSLSTQVHAATGAEIRTAINSFLKLGDDQSLRMTSSVRFEPEYATCGLIVQNQDSSAMISLSKLEKTAEFEVENQRNIYSLRSSDNEVSMGNQQGLRMSFVRRVPSRSPEGNEISVMISDGKGNSIHCLVVR
jgi:hypothetical protein